MGNKPIKNKKNKNKDGVKDGLAVERQISVGSGKEAIITTLVRRNQNNGLPSPVTNAIKPVPNGLPLPAPIPISMPQTVDRTQKLSITSVDKNDNIVIAMYAYRAENEGDLSFRKGEKLEIIEKSDPDWWTVKRIDTGETGYIPANYVGSTAIESEE